MFFCPSSQQFPCWHLSWQTQMIPDRPVRIPSCNVCVVSLSGGQDGSAEVEHRSHAAAVLQITGVGGLSHPHTHTNAHTLTLTHTHTHTETH